MKSVVLLVAAVIAVAGCTRKTPEAVKPTLEAERAATIKVADEAATVCLAAKGRAIGAVPANEPLPPPNPAKGTSLEKNETVYDVFVTCSWPVPGKPGMTAGASLPALKGNKPLPVTAVTMPEDSVESSCTKSPSKCEQILTPSRYSVQKASADLRVVRPTADGGEAEVIAVFATR
jgi:hypothetical protein